MIQNLENLLPLKTIDTPLFLPVLSMVLAISIFVLDTITALEIAIAVFYIVIILMSVSFCRKRGVIIVSAGCVVLTIISYFLSFKGSMESGLVNLVISVLAIAITTFLVLRIESARVAIHEARAHMSHVSRIIALGELTASIAHEVNQPLAAVVTSGNACLRWLNDQAPNIGKAREAVGRMISDANRASEIIVRIRNLARKSPSCRDFLDINELITETLSLMQTEIEKSNIVLDIELSRNLPQVYGDRVQIQQTLLNLFINANEAMMRAEGTNRILSVRTVMGEESEVQVSVHDSGTGIDPAISDHIFEAFYSTKPDGMGIGLAIVQSILEEHGGRIWQTSNQPSGTSFYFTIPTQRERY